MQAAERGEWEVVVEVMQQAIDDHPEETLRVRSYGMNYIDYLPYYWLGLAKYRLGDCDGALLAWTVSESQGVVQQRSELYDILTAGRRDCRQQIDAFNRAVRGAESQISRATNAGNSLASLRNDPDLMEVWDQRPSLGPQQERGWELLGQARAKLEEGRYTKAITEVEDAGVLGDQALGLFNRIANEATQLRDRIRRDRELAEAEADEEVAGGAADPDIPEPPPGEDPGDEPGPGETEETGTGETERPGAGETEETGTGETGERGTGEVEQPDPVDTEQPGPADTEEAESVETGDDRPPYPPPPATDTPPADLVDAAKAYFDAEYQRTLEILTQAEFPDVRVEAQASLFRAAARFALYVLGGEANEQLRAAAVEDIRACRSMVPDFAPDPAFFSPRFRTFFDSSS